MGQTVSKPVTSSKFTLIPDKFTTLQQVQSALKQSGLEGSNLIFAIDYTASNLENGRYTFGDKSLHNLDDYVENPYQFVIKCIGRTLEPFDEDKLIPCYGFGDLQTKSHSVFNMHPEKKPCYTFNEIISRYDTVTKNVQLSGPTSFVPIVNKAVEIVKETGSYHILIIITDGCVVDEANTANAIINASNYPLSIITIGVGDGEYYDHKTGIGVFNTMEKFDDKLYDRKFDNFQFVNLNKVILESKKTGISLDSLFAVAALQEIPDQYQYLKQNNMLSIKPVHVPESKFEIMNTALYFKDNTKDNVKNKINNNNECPVCLSNNTSMVIDPCGHKICDGECKKVTACPVCRAEIKKYIRTYP